MKTFAVRKNGKIPTENEFINFMNDYLGISEFSPNFFINRDLIKKVEYIDTLETSLYNESELDKLSIDWEFIDITD